MKMFCSFLLVTLLLVQANGAKGADVTLKKGDRIVFFGDSITFRGTITPTGYINLIKNSISAAHPDWGIETINAGVNGNTAGHLKARLQKDVLDKKPSIVFIYIGANDIGHWEQKKDRKGSLVGNKPKEIFESCLKDIITRLKAANVQAVLCTAAVFGEKIDGTNEREKQVAECCETSRAVAAEMKVPLVDINKAFTDYLKVHNQANQPSKVLTTDSVHLNAAGNKLVAEQMLKILGMPLVDAPDVDQIKAKQ